MIKNVIMLLFITALSLNAKELPLDAAHSSVEFKITHLVVATVTGSFNKLEGSAVFDQKNSRISNVSLKIDTASIFTNDADRDKHLRSADFFDVKKYPVITFTSEGVKIKKDKIAKMKGNLTIRGVSREVVLNLKYNGSVTDPWENIHHSFSANGEISRKDFGLNWNKTLDKGGVMIGDKVRIAIEAQILE